MTALGGCTHACWRVRLQHTLSAPGHAGGVMGWAKGCALLAVPVWRAVAAGLSAEGCWVDG